MSSIQDKPTTRTFAEFSKHADYSLMDSLQADPQATNDGDDHLTREVFSGHYVPVTPTAIPEPEYISHSSVLFKELGLSQELALDELFRRLFSGHNRGSRTYASIWLGYRLCTINLRN